MKIIFLLISTLLIVIYGCEDGAHTHYERPVVNKAAGDIIGSSKDTSVHNGIMIDIIKDMITDMKSQRLSGSADNDYALLMTIHHSAAIELADIEYTCGEHLNVAREAQRISEKQKDEINAFQTFSTRYKPNELADSFRISMTALIKNMEDTIHEISTVDNQFIEMMATLLKSSIDFSKRYLRFAKDAKLKEIALNTISANNREIKKLKAMKPD